MNPEGSSDNFHQVRTGRGIQEPQVWQAADALLHEGLRPTIERVRQKIGSGSPNTVSPMLERWFATLGQRLGGPWCRHGKHSWTGSQRRAVASAGHPPGGRAVLGVRAPRSRPGAAPEARCDCATFAAPTFWNRDPGLSANQARMPQSAPRASSKVTREIWALGVRLQMGDRLRNPSSAEILPGPSDTQLRSHAGLGENTANARIDRAWN